MFVQAVLRSIEKRRVRRDTAEMEAGRITISRPHGVTTFFAVTFSVITLIELRLIIVNPQNSEALGGFLQFAPLAVLCLLFLWYKATWRVKIDAASPGILRVTRGLKNRHFVVLQADIRRWEAASKGWYLWGENEEKLLFVPRSARYSDLIQVWLETYCGAVEGHSSSEKASGEVASTPASRTTPRNPFNA
ncbi:MAG: hypothetical protein LKI93_02985 [Bifidobacteriaceae bacterium]|jgi:hypothetical protein|nr:hypothetical protein [Bifidobacteriaceae bacterium]MCI1915173.1 hypothetical protein [Bifidobacteriaceae bacterium]